MDPLCPLGDAIKAEASVSLAFDTGEWLVSHGFVVEDVGPTGYPSWFVSSKCHGAAARLIKIAGVYMPV